MVTGDIWDQVLTRIENKVNRHSFYTWFKPTRSSPTGGAVPGRVPNAIFRDWLSKHYAGVIHEALDELGEAQSCSSSTEGAAEPRSAERAPAEPSTGG